LRRNTHLARKILGCRGREQGPLPTIATTFYRRLYQSLAEGAPLAITPQQVRRQIAVIEECHRQNPLSRLSGQ
jgi:hypothetical protein